MGSRRDLGDKEHGNNFAEAEGRDFTSHSQVIADSTRNTTQMMICYAGFMRVFNSVTPDKAQAVMLIAAAAAAAAAEAAIDSSSKAPSLESTMNGIPTARSPSQQMLQHTDGSDLIYKFKTELPIARRNSLQCFLEKRRERLCTRKIENAPYDGCSANDSTSSSSFK